MKKKCNKVKIKSSNLDNFKACLSSSSFVELRSRAIFSLREAFIKKIREILGQVKVNKNDKVVQRLKHLHPHEEVDALPFFTLKNTTRKMQDVSANILNVISAKKDAELLKMLFSKAGEEFAQNWILVPTGIHLLTSPGLVKAYLRQQMSTVLILNL